MMDETRKTIVQTGSPESFGWLRRPEYERNCAHLVVYEKPDGHLVAFRKDQNRIVARADLPPLIEGQKNA